MRNYLLVNIIIYSLGYLVYCFMYWSLCNPFQWVVNIPNMSVLDRTLYIFFIPLYQFLLLMICGVIKEKHILR